MYHIFTVPICIVGAQTSILSEALPLYLYVHKQHFKILVFSIHPSVRPSIPISPFSFYTHAFEKNENIYQPTQLPTSFCLCCCWLVGWLIREEKEDSSSMVPSSSSSIHLKALLNSEFCCC